jgi:site-specific DNA-methyltransferase (adenine-specific)
VLTRGKASPPDWSPVLTAVSRLEKSYRPGHSRLGAVSPDIQMLFHPKTLDQLCFIREYLLGKDLRRWSRSDYMIAGAIAGILHGTTRKDGSSAYLSVSMPNTFSMSPNYVGSFIRANGLKPLAHNVFARLRHKLARLYLDDPTGAPSRAHNGDAIRFLGDSLLVPDESVDLLLTSPPYLKVVNYASANWIRLWWLGLSDVARNDGVGRRLLDQRLDHSHTYERYREFMLRFLRGVSRVLRKDGLAAVVIGDVAEPHRPTLRLAERLWEDIGPTSTLGLLDVIVDSVAPRSKVTRIWGKTRGHATDQDRILMLHRLDGEPRAPQPVEWEEPYKDAGPDDAHAQLE